MDLTILKIKGTRCEGGKEVEKLAKEREKRKSQAIKLLKKANVSYEKQANKP
jgi:hypothetical protein